jgi:hypothetical protein
MVLWNYKMHIFRDVINVTLNKPIAGSGRLIIIFTDTEGEECNIFKISAM